MSKATLTLKPTVTLSKLDPTDWTRATFSVAFAMARRMIRDRRTTTAAAAWSWYLPPAGASPPRPAGASPSSPARSRSTGARSATPAPAASRTSSARALVRCTRRPRPGNLTATVAYRCAAFERLRDHGFSLAWTFDPLASGSNRSLRVHRAKRLRAERRAILAEVRAEERQVAMIMAEDRFALTLTGLFVLRNAESGKA